MEHNNLILQFLEMIRSKQKWKVINHKYKQSN